jgi:hypothetical protein
MIFSFEGCWRSVMVNADGIILVYNPDAPGQDQQINDWVNDNLFKLQYYLKHLLCSLIYLSVKMV